MFWQLVLTVERNTAAVLHWSWWRRWHQGRARFYHYRRREAETATPCQQHIPSRQAEVPQADVTGVVWSRLEALLPPVKRVGRPFGHARRVVLTAIVHVMRTNCGWQHLPAHFPPWQTVYSQFTMWRKTGVWEAIWAGLDTPKPLPEEQLQL